VDRLEINPKKRRTMIEIKDASGAVVAVTGIEAGERVLYYASNVELVGEKGAQSLLRVNGGEDYLLFTAGLNGGIAPATALDAALWLS
jgi:hypothetical protein